MAAALNYLHLLKEPITHCNVSSPNILLQALSDNHWRAKLCDFGSAKLVCYAKTANPGALAYCVPELCTLYRFTKELSIAFTRCLQLWGLSSSLSHKSSLSSYNHWQGFTAAGHFVCMCTQWRDPPWPLYWSNYVTNLNTAYNTDYNCFKLVEVVKIWNTLFQFVCFISHEKKLVTS